MASRDENGQTEMEARGGTYVALEGALENELLSHIECALLTGRQINKRVED